ncbi:MAG TPA: hypothetical protein VNV42_13280 [Solirubrobacteraceae bacterium]|nr:hypothetical protein [Solirubrobacteraceae bacterium]
MPSELLEALRAQPGGEQLLTVAREGVYLVGGAVRDLLRGETPRELDVVVEAGAGEEDEGEGLLAGLGGEAHVHDRFGTATVTVGGTRVDVARARRERYPAPGALPEVEPAGLREDLRRRDFTVNAIALALAGPRAGELSAVEHAREDLRAGLLRVLHDGSFIDDPTRLWRLGRYRARTGFEIEEHTAQLAAQALAGEALDTVSRARVGAELRLALGEPDPVAALQSLRELGVLAALEERLGFDARLAASALDLLAEAAASSPGAPLRPDLLLLGVMFRPMGADVLEEGVELAMYELLDGMGFPGTDRERVLRMAICADAMADELAHAEESSEIYEAVSHESLEGVALAGAWDESGWSDAWGSAHRWLTQLRHVNLQITGDDLIAAGIPEGPEIGRRLEAALCAKLDEQLDDGRAAELAAALRVR